MKIYDYSIIDRKGNKKDLARIAMTYDNVYVASISLGGNMQQTIKALTNANKTLKDQLKVVTDETTKTNIDGVFAIGDVRTKPVRQIVTATADGAVCVHFAEEYIGNCGF